MKYSALFLCMVLCCTQSLFAQKPVSLQKNDLSVLRDRMVGEFSSESQSKEDTAFMAISLKMVPIWTNRTDGYWLYVEQAMMKALQKPYRQRIYHISQQDDMTLKSKVFEIPDPMRFAGAADQPALLSKIPADSLIDRKGCTIFLLKDADGRFYGNTPGKECLSSLRGARYATSEVIIEPNRLLTWDRGWDEAGKQVWGSVKGGYRFDRVLPE